MISNNLLSMTAHSHYHQTAELYRSKWNTNIMIAFLLFLTENWYKYNTIPK